MAQAVEERKEENSQKVKRMVKLFLATIRYAPYLYTCYIVNEEKHLKQRTCNKVFLKEKDDSVLTRTINLLLTPSEMCTQKVHGSIISITFISNTEGKEFNHKKYD